MFFHVNVLQQLHAKRIILNTPQPFIQNLAYQIIQLFNLFVAYTYLRRQNFLTRFTNQLTLALKDVRLASQKLQLALQKLAPSYKLQSMTEISNSGLHTQCFHEQVIEQQQTLISALKQEIMRLQAQLIETQEDRDAKTKMYEQSQQQIDILQEKVKSLQENNQSIIQTFKVFQREFVKRDYKMDLLSPRKNKDTNSDAPLFIELIRNMRLKFSESSVPSVSLLQKSYLSQYYGFFFQQQLKEDESELYNQSIQPGKLKPKKMRSWGKKNYFNEKYRHYFWFNIVENHLKISYKQYEILLESYDGNRENQSPKRSIIDLDLRRMDFKIDEDKSQSMKVEVKKCLQLFKIYRPDIGYVQGMSYLAWMFLIRMEGFQSFVCFSNLILTDPFINTLYSFKGESIKRIILFHQECLLDKRPKLHKHMQSLMVESQLFIIEWAYTMFSRAFNLRISSKIWDLWLCEGFNVFFKVVITILEMLEPVILQQNQNDKIVEILRTQTHKLDEAQFLSNLQKKRLFQDLKLE